MIAGGIAIIGFLIAWFVQSGFGPSRSRAQTGIPAPTQPSNPPAPVGGLLWIYTETIPLIDAAKEVYGKTRTSRAAQLAQSDNNSADQTLTWYSHAIMNTVVVWGKRPASLRFEELALSGYTPHYDPKTDTVSATIPDTLGIYTTLRVAKDDLEAAVRKIRDIETEPSWAPDLISATSPDSKVAPKDKKQKDLVASATLLFNAEDATLSVVTYDAVKSLAVEPVHSNYYTIVPQSYIIRFAFKPYQGPFDIHIDGGGIDGRPWFFYTVTRNEDRLVSVTASRDRMASQTHQVSFRFYRKLDQPNT